MEAADIYRVQVVREDLEFLRDKWDNSIDEASLRRSSNVLRTLLVDGHLGRAWRSLGLEKQPIVLAPDLDAMLVGIDPSRVQFAQAGGAHYQQAQIMCALEVNFAMTPEQIRNRFERGPHSPIREFPLSKLLESRCLISRGSSINRRELIQYVANKLGGTHIDSSRDDSKDFDRRLKDIDHLLQGLMVLGIRPAYFELLSIGQSLVRSPDIERFLVVARNAGGANLSV